jgi:hypothetical protein
MLNRLFSWLTAAVVFALNGALLWHLHQSDRASIAFAVLGVNLIGLYGSRRALAYLSQGAESPPSKAQQLSERKKTQSVTSSGSSRTQALVYGAGMGFGLGIFLTGCYLADVHAV